ncbi:MAG: beta-N-acetylhexosaminidase [Anaerolineae bacterium]|jgi:beta-N-acetylhexosaminidase|nr:beta-N-acetylhexosaminidase [Anaerolineae bacterium]
MSTPNDNAPPTPTTASVTTASPTTTQPNFTPQPTPTPSPDIEALLAQMTLEQKIGQVMVIGFDGPEADSGLLEMIEDYHVGGVILFARNVESPRQVATLTNALQNAAALSTAVESNRPGLLIAIDQEGGRVARLTENKGFTEFPSAMALTATGNVENARRVAQAMAAEMRAVGINTDFAPVLDVNNNPANPVIGIRSFSSEPELVAQYGVAFLEGLQTGGVLAFGKHFPGHGDTSVDSHVSLPLVPHERARLEAVEFVPFNAAIRANVAGIMSAHVTFPAIDATPGLAATLSSKVLTGLLREELGYGGLLVTDSLEMGALAQSGYPVPIAAATALQAGADLLLFNRDHTLHRAAFREIQTWVQDGRIPKSRLNEAVRRVLQAKAAFGLFSPEMVDVNLAEVACGTPETKAQSHAIADQSITLVHTGSPTALPLAPDSKLLVVETPAANGLGRALDVPFIVVDEQPTRAQRQSALSMARDGRTVIVAVADASRFPEQVKLVEAFVKTSSPVIVVAIRTPYDLATMPEQATLLATYGLNPPTLEALLRVLRGEVLPRGRLPVTLAE